MAYGSAAFGWHRCWLPHCQPKVRVCIGAALLTLPLPLLLLIVQAENHHSMDQHLEGLQNILVTNKAAVTVIAK